MIPVEPDLDHASEGKCTNQRPIVRPHHPRLCQTLIRRGFFMPNFALQAAQNLTAVRNTQPLVHNITNFVVMNFTANVLLACGASPVMAHAENEVEDMVAIAQALVLNIGTLEDSWVTAMLKAAKAATRLHKPVVLDPVGAGATPLRTQAAMVILAQGQIKVLRGNASEILALAQKNVHTKGVDAYGHTEDIVATVQALALKHNITVAVTGPTDLVTDGQRTLLIQGGHPLMPKITGTGCSASALVGAFLAVDPDPVTAASSALAYLAVAGKRAGATALGPGSFQTQFLDTLYSLTPQELADQAVIHESSHA